jgi:hypothetical protein
MHKIRHVKMKVHQRRKRERKNKVQIMQYQEMVKARVGARTRSAM